MNNARQRLTERVNEQSPAPGATIELEDDQMVDEPAKRAVLYLRVSTPSQVNTDYNPEGISIPAQRDACELKAKALNAEIVHEFVEPGRSATNVERRPVFQEMLAWIKDKKDIDFIVCHQFSRMFRDSVDAGITKRDLAKHNTRVVSTAMDLGEGPESNMVETILHAVDEYRSKADGADIAYKMGAKAKSGGTLGRARLGYLNARDLSEGRNIGIVTLDPDRAPLVKTAFELYATGDYSFESLAAELTRRGLRTRPGRHAGGPVSISKIGSLLRDPYYIGLITYKDEIYQGRHEPLISDDLFDRVQLVLEERSGGGERQRRHHHYLKGSLWCGHCRSDGIESRMIMQWAKGNGGKYRYYFCRRKQEHKCGTRYVEGRRIEYALIQFYASLRFPSDAADDLRRLMRETLDEEETASRLLHEQLTAEVLRLDRQEENLLDLVADGEESSIKIKQRLAVIIRKRNLIASRLRETGDRLAAGAALIQDALALLEDPQRLYKRMAPEQRRQMNQAIFERLYVFDDSIGEAVFRPPFDELMEAKEFALSLASSIGTVELVTPHGSPKGASADRMRLAQSFLGDGSNKRVMVEVLADYSNHADQGERLRTLLEMARSGASEPKTQTGKQVHRRLRPVEIEQLVAGYQAGATVYQLSDRFRISRSIMSQHLEREDVPRRHRPMSEAQAQMAVRLYSNGMSSIEVGAQLGRDPRAVRRVLQKARVRMRDSHGRDRC